MPDTVRRARLAILVQIASRPRPLALLVGVLALLVLLPGLGGPALWSQYEIAVLDRARAALGEPLSGLQRSPWLPDALRTAGYAVFGGELGLRLPHAGAAAALAGVTAYLARLRGLGPASAGLAGGFCLAFPVVVTSGRSVLGNPVGELCGALAIVFVLTASTAESPLGRWIRWIAALAAITAAIASSGIVLGGALPVLASALALARGDRRSQALLGLAATLAAAGVALSLAQTDGYVPLLGAAKDLELQQRPEQRVFSASLAELGYQTFPWLPLAIAGTLLGVRRDAWPGAWLVAGLAVCSIWSAVYGPGAVPLAVPVAIGCAGAVEGLLATDAPAIVRRFVLAATVLGVLVLRKDAERTPRAVVAPLSPGVTEHNFPAKRVEAPRSLAATTERALLALAILALLPWMRRRLRPIHERTATAATVAILGATLLAQAATWAQRLIPAVHDNLGLKIPFGRWHAWVESGALPPVLAVHHTRDRGIAIYGPPEDGIRKTENRHEIVAHLSAGEPAVALVRRPELAALHENHRRMGWPLHVLDQSNADLVLVANVLPAGATDENPIPGVLLDAPPELAHPTLVRFGDVVELVSWQVHEPVIRGHKVVLELGFRVLATPPSSIKIHARLQRAKTSRLNYQPHALTGDVYPPQWWREGDYVLHRYEFDAPYLEILSGPHELIVALFRGDQDKVPITVPADEAGEFEVRVRDKARHYASVGWVEVW